MLYGCVPVCVCVHASACMLHHAHVCVLCNVYIVHASLGILQYILHCKDYTTLAMCVGGEIENGVLCGSCSTHVHIYRPMLI